MSLLNNQENNLVVNNLASEPKEQKSHQIIEMPNQPLVDITPILLQNPDGILAWAFSIALVIQIIKPSPQLLDAFGRSISLIINAVGQLMKSLNSKNKDNQ
jgi:hypothetical protein